MSALDQPLDRVNYFNGQRLDAADFRADQDYQTRIRRKLLSSLYSIGIVQGLEVNQNPDKHKVTISPGVALDFQGREIILLESTDVLVSGTPTPSSGVIFGNFLTISYAEQRVQPISDGCTAPSDAKGCGGNLAWGAPTRIRAAPKFDVVDTWPSDLSGKIVLAQIGLSGGCQVTQIQSGVRRYAVAAKPPTTRPISIEGEKDINSSNPKVLYFHIDGGLPTSVSLYLRGAQFSTLFYSELGSHSHDNTLTGGQANLPVHHHTLTNLTSGDANQDSGKALGLSVNMWNDNIDQGVRMWGPPSWPDNGPFHRGDPTTITAPDTLPIIILQNFNAHTHSFDSSAQTDDCASNIPLTQGTFTNAAAGLSPPPARTTGQPLSYVSSLSVLYDGNDITGDILQQLGGIDPVSWPLAPVAATLGDGTPTHVFVKAGTGPIDLTQVSGLDFTPGEHSLTFQVADIVSGGQTTYNGGQIQYNLYVG